MDDLYTFAAHKTLPFANPFHPGTMDRAIDLLALRSGAPVADFGAGFCELGIRIVERYQAQVVAVELGKRMAAAARERIHARIVAPGLKGGVTVHEGDAGAFRATIDPASYDATICIGSSHALGGYAKTLEVLHRLTRRAGLVLVGEGFWEKRPSPEYLAATGIAENEFASFAENIDAATRAGLRPLWAVAASQREWDEYEWAHARNLEAFAAEHPGDEKAQAFLARSRSWRDAFIRWGRGTLGFGLYLFRTE